jgi:hypothetical protein
MSWHEEKPICKGDVVTLNKRVGVVVFVGNELGPDMEDHTGVWFGDTAKGKPVVCTVPTEYLAKGPEPTLKH